MDKSYPSSKRPWLVSVCAGWQQEASLRKAKQEGIPILAIDADPKAACRDLVDQFLCHDIRDFKGCYQAIVERNIEVGGVASFISDAGMLTAAALRELFHLPGMGVNDTLRFVNKAQQRTRLGQHHIRQPRWTSGNLFSEVSERTKDFTAPYVIKPTDSAGSRGVFKFRSPLELEKWFPISQSYSATREVIVEEFIHGTEYSVESITLNGVTHILAISERFKHNETSASEIVTIEWQQPLCSRIEEAVSEALRALGLHNGPAHSEVIADSTGKIFIVEIANRGGGFWVCDELVPSASGYDLTQAIVRLAMGIPVPPPSGNLRNAVCLRYVLGTRGVLRGYSEPAKLQNQNIAIRPLVNLGAKTSDPINDGDRVAIIRSIASTVEECRRTAERVERDLNFNIVTENPTVGLVHAF